MLDQAAEGGGGAAPQRETPRTPEHGCLAVKEHQQLWFGEGDLNPKLLAKILRVFAAQPVKNRRQPPRSVSAAHIRLGVGDEAVAR
jgi:hypothetical protein